MKPPSLTVELLATLSKLSVDRLHELADQLPKHVHGPVTQYVRGKRREIYKPEWKTKCELRKIHRALSRCEFEHQSAQGGVKGRSCVDAARIHMGSRAQCIRDIQNCYPSITYGELHAALLDRGFKADVALLLVRLMTIDGRVPQGLPLSSDALNLFMYPIDVSMHQFVKNLGGLYSRTYDDMVASSPKAQICKKIETKLDELLEDFPLQVNEEKKAKNGFSYAHEKRSVHNLPVNSSSELALSNEQKKQAIELAVSFVRSARCVSPETLRALAKKRQKVCGWISFSGLVNKKTSRHLSRLLRDGDRLVMNILASDGIAPHKKQWYFGAVNRKLPHPLFSKMVEQWKRAAAAGRRIAS